MKLKIARVQALLNQNNPNADEAMKLLKPMVNKKSAPWQVYHYSGVAFMQKKEYQTALSFFRKSIEEGADEPQTYHSMSYCYYHLGKYSDAEEYEKTALGKKPDYFKGWLHLGAVYRAQAKLEKALKCYQKANQLDPKSAGVAFRIGDIYNDQGDMNKALELYDITIKIDSNYLNAYLAKAEILKKKRKFDEAEDTIYKVLSMEPRNLAARVSLAELNKYSGKYDKALELYERLVGEFPKNMGVRVNYALCMQELGRFEESEKNYLKAFKDQPSSFEPLSNYLMGLHYNPERTKEEIFEAHKLWDQHFAPKKKPVRPIPFNTDRNKRLRVGFISGGFRGHPVGWMITKALENLPENQFEIYCYTTNNKFDKVTKRIHKAIDKWQSVIGYNDEVIARMIRDDEIDILVELSGHSADTRLKTVALEPAPVIVKWVGGLFNTTGLESVDYLITDHQETPEGEEPFYTEKLVRMPDDYICFLPPDHAPEVGELPAKENGYITFGCFNNPTKVNDIVLEKWAEVMKQTPDSRLFLKSKQYETGALRQRIIGKMTEAGVSEDRLIFEGHSMHDKLLACYNRVDIALDPWPYSGGLTTCEALWMGVPVVTNPGPTFAGRHSTTHLMNAGLSEWVAENWNDYIQKVTGLAADTKKLAEIRASLRSKLKDSPLCDGQRFGAYFSTALRKVWEQWVDGYEKGNPDWQNHINIEALSDEEIEREADRQPASTGLSDLSVDYVREVARKSEQLVRQLDENEQQKTMDQEIISQTKKLANNGISGTNGSHKNGAAKNKNGSVANFPDTYKIETKDDLTICTPPDLKMLTPFVLLEQEQWYENEMDFIREYLKPGMNMLDAGAGFGVYALPASKTVGKEGNVFAFEPGSLARRHLEMSKLENKFDNLDIIGKALSDSAGNAVLIQAETPELNELDEKGKQGEKVSKITLDEWWKFEGKPELDLIKIDLNGHESQALAGAGELLENSSPIILFGIGEDGQNGQKLHNQLSSIGYKLYEYIPGPELLTEHDAQAGCDPYMQNLIAIKKDRYEELQQDGWFHNESFEPQEPETGLWKKELKKQPWTEHVISGWEKQALSPQNKEYLRALDYIVAAGQVDPGAGRDSRSEKAVLLLGAAQILIQLYNNGRKDPAISLTLVRTLNRLGKRGQAVEVMQTLVETTKFGQENMNIDLPFLLPLQQQDQTAVKTDFSKWLMVRTVEAWILLKDVTTYLSGEQERKLLVALRGNQENQAYLERLFILMQQRKGKKYFSQFGEDRILEKLLTPHQAKGFYVDIGAFHPYKYSNTALMNLFGWQGINIDANKEAIEAFNRIRPKDKNVYSAVSETNGEIEFFVADELGEVNTLSEKHRKKWRDRGVIYKTKKVPSKRLDSLLNDHVGDKTAIDFMNIDVEDAEMGVLKSNDWEKYRPGIIAIEIHELNENAVYEKEVAAYIKEKGYRFITYKKPTAFFKDVRKAEYPAKSREKNDEIRYSGNEDKRIKHITLAAPGVKGGAHGLPALRVNKMAKIIKEKGIGAKVVSASGTEFLDAVVYAGKNPGHVVYSGVMGYDLQIHSDMNLTGNLFDILNVPVFGQLVDHPYTKFMWHRMENCSNNTVFITPRKSIAYEFEQIYNRKNRIEVLNNLSPSSIIIANQNADKPLDERSIDLLIPWGLHKFFVNQHSLKKQLKPLGEAAVNIGRIIYQSAMNENERSIFEIFLDVTQREFGEKYQFSNPKSGDDRIWLEVLSLIDWRVRKDRRIEMLKSLKDVPDNFQLAITANPQIAKAIPELNGKSNIKWIGEVSAEKLNSLYGNSKIVLNCNPTYPDVIHGRIRNGMANGCFLISDYNLVLQKIFGRKDAIGFIGKGRKDVTDFLSAGWSELQKKADTGKNIIRSDFTVENHARELIALMNKHYNS